MDLDYLRNIIDQTDKEIIKLFEKRMETVAKIAQYKKENNLPVLNSNREEEVLKKIRDNSNTEFADYNNAMFIDIMEISKCYQAKKNLKPFELQDYQSEINPMKVACQGESGAYSEIAATKMFSQATRIFYRTFDEVFEAVKNGDVDSGILPIENSSAGTVNDVYDLLLKYDLYISKSHKLKIEHCIATKNSDSLQDISCVISHEQALAQCSNFIKSNNLNTTSYLNTALSAQKVANSNEKLAAICSEKCAKDFGLTILKSSIQNNQENYTKFVAITKKPLNSAESKTVSIAISIPNVSHSLYKLLAKFSVANVNLTKIESRPLGNKNFDVIFYLDFDGNIYDEKTKNLISSLIDESLFFKYLGNF